MFTRDFAHLFIRFQMVVFKYISNKDAFQKFYSKMLAKRLVSELSASDEGESIMITKLKQMCGFEYTSKLQRMFTDANLSKDISDLFRKVSAPPAIVALTDFAFELQSEEGKSCIDVSIMVLTTGIWPMSQQMSFDIPPVLSDSIEKFTQFYQGRHNGRRLSFLLASSRGELVSTSFTARYTFVVGFVFLRLAPSANCTRLIFRQQSLKCRFLCFSIKQTSIQSSNSSAFLL